VHPPSVMVLYIHTSLYPNQHLDWFNHFCNAKNYISQVDSNRNKTTHTDQVTLQVQLHDYSHSNTALTAADIAYWPATPATHSSYPRQLLTVTKRKQDHPKLINYSLSQLQRLNKSHKNSSAMHALSYTATVVIFFRYSILYW